MTQIWVIWDNIFSESHSFQGEIDRIGKYRTLSARGTAKGYDILHVADHTGETL